MSHVHLSLCGILVSLTLEAVNFRRKLFDKWQNQISLIIAKVSTSFASHRKIGENKKNIAVLVNALRTSR